MVDLEYVETFPSQSIDIALESNFNVVQDGQFVLDAVNMVDNVACGAEQAYCRNLTVSGTTHILSEPVTYPPAYYFMANPELTAASRRQVTMMSNIYHVQNPKHFQQVHQAITLQTTPRDMTLAYTKHHLEGLSLMMMNEWQRQWPAAQFNVNCNVNNASEIHYDDPNGAPNNTNTWLQNCISGSDAPYYARLGTMLNQIIFDAAMYAQYPEWDHTMTTTDPAGNQVDFNPISNLVRFQNEPATNHRTYTMSNTVYNLGNIPTPGGHSQVLFPLQPPSFEEWFKAGYNGGADNRLSGHSSKRTFVYAEYHLQ